ncbi:gamma-glutamylcyclotransferase family protein [Halomonas sp. YLGW01]|uniref:gamma-glutamylcyclotransferase family protein n=1 Tax=Halomonas sp. YLGW01 TaxID=2773308 RepID=UPI001786DB71|nr:gamma-glutamylcyclotransferase family protein [Halomonas sp. YLGW01]
MPHLMFVYGTLKRGFVNHAAHLAKAEFVDRGTTCDAYPLVLHGEDYRPVLVEVKGRGHRVTGELYRVDERTLDALDHLQRINDHDGYRRRRLAISDSQGNTCGAWVYMKPCAWVEDVRSDPMACFDDDRHRA